MDSEITSGKKHKRRDGLQRQAQIMTIALKLFSEKGFNNTSIEDIITTAGIVKRTFYLHFEGKNELLDRIINSCFEILYANIKVLDLSIQIPVGEIKKFFINMARFLTHVPELQQFAKIILRDLPALNEYFLEKIYNFQSDVINLLSEYHSRGQMDGRILNNIDAKIISTCFIGAAKEILFRWLILEEDIDMEKAIITTVDLFYRGTFVSTPE